MRKPRANSFNELTNKEIPGTNSEIDVRAICSPIQALLVIAMKLQRREKLNQNTENNSGKMKSRSRFLPEEGP